jgi:TonB family protein
MERNSFQTPISPHDGLFGTALGLVFSIGLFVVMALAQSMGEIDRPTREIDERVVFFEVPKIEKIEDTTPPEEEVEEPPPELAAETMPQFSLDQLDVALNVGTGGGEIAGDFVLPQLSREASALDAMDEEDFVAFADLDRIPRPLQSAGLRFPTRLLRKKVEGKVVLHLRLGPDGRVLDASVEWSDLPDFDEFVAGEVASWVFTPPTRHGTPVYAEARFPIPIQIQ